MKRTSILLMPFISLSAQEDAFVALQFTPVGISVGKKVCWYFELGIGHAFMGFMTGVSWRF